MKKRSFIKSLILTGLSAPLQLSAMDKLIEQAGKRSLTDVASDDEFWKAIRGEYKLKPDYINLENGYYNILPKEILESYIQHIRDVNYQGSYYMRTVQFDNKKNMASKVAELAGCTTEELILTRNTTESLDMIIGGLHWNAGDEAIMAEQKYGVINKIVSVPNHPKDDDEIVNLYANAITDKTKLLMVSHMINITGQILPIQKICDMAHRKGVEVMVDGAHAIAHIQFNIPDLHCDYYGASLHKWLSVPLGVGMLYVRKEKIENVWPLLAEGERKENDISRLNHIGTHPVHTDLTVADAVDFYKKIGAERKEERLRFLQQYWTTKLRGIDNVILNTPADPKRSCGIANVGIKGMIPSQLADTLLKKYKIYTVAIDGANVHGCRITPNIFTTVEELEVLVKAIKELAA